MPASLFYTGANFVLKGERAVPKRVQYANLQLLVGHHAFPPKEGTSEPVTAPYASQYDYKFQDLHIFFLRVFATRLCTSTPTWNHVFKRWDWQRFAVNTVPRLSGPSPLDRINIPWPVPTPRVRGDGRFTLANVGGPQDSCFG